MRDKKVRKLNVMKLFPWLAFGLPVLLMLIVFAVDGIYPFGNRCFLSTDLYHQYTPFFTEFMRAIREGKGLAYSWNIGVGSNFLALYVYYLASPLHFLGLLVPERHIIEFLTYLVVFKIGLCGWAAYWYLQKRESKVEQSEEYRAAVALFFSLGYALSGFLAAYNWNIMWLDCVVLLPFIMYGLEQLVKEGKPYLYCVTLALSIWTNYYISIMICIFLVLYFVYLFCMKRSFRAVWQFVVFSLLAAGMASALLIPEVCAILATDFGSIDFPKKVDSYFSVLDMLARHCVIVSPEKGLDHWPNIYCGVAALLFVPLFAVNDKISVKKRFGALALAGILLVSFSTSVLNFIWHGLNYPDSLPARQSFIYIFIVLVMCFDGAMHLDFTDVSQKRRMVQAYLGVVVLVLFFEKFAEHEDIVMGAEWLTLLFVTLYAGLWYALYLQPSKLKRNLLLYFCVLVMVVEVGVNTGVTSVSNVSRDAYLEKLEDYKTLYQWTKEEENGFYRVEKFTRKTKNDGALAGYPTASVFSSTMNSAVMDFYKRMGMRHSKVFYEYDGSTPFSSALLNVNYLFAESAEYENSQFELCRESNGVYLYRPAEILPFGYVAPIGYDLPEGYSDSGLRLQNQMVHDLGIDALLFEKFECDTAADDVHFQAEKEGFYYGLINDSGTAKVKVTGGKPGELEWKNLKRGSIVYLGYLKGGDYVTISNNDTEDTTKNISAMVYRMDEEVLHQALAKLKEQHLEEVVYDSTHLSGMLNLQQEGRLILSVPYEKGYTVWVNGEKTEPELFGGTFMALDLAPGEYQISLKYVPYGQNVGRVISAVSLLLFLGVIWLGRKVKARTKK